MVQHQRLKAQMKSIMGQRSFTPPIRLILFSTVLASLGMVTQAQPSRILPNPTAQASTPQRPTQRPPTMSPKMSPKITALVQQLNHPKADQRIAAAHQLGEMRAFAKVTVPSLIPLLKDANPNVRISASQAFQKMQESASDAIPHLIPLLNDPNVEVRIWVPYALAEMGDLAIDAVPELKRLLQDPNVDISVGAAMALSRIDRETRTATLTSLIVAMQDNDPKVRSQAAYNLSFMRRFARDVIPQLQSLLRDPRPDVRQAAGDILSTIAIDAKIVIPSPAVP